MAPITGLAPELLQRILDFLQPSEHLNLALASKTLHSRLNYSLLYNQNCHRKYHAVSDIQPSTIPDLVRAILFKDDHIAAWHIRAIDIWGCRITFADWKPYRLISPTKTNSPAEESQEAGTEVAYQDGYFTDAEIEAFKEAMVDLFKLPDTFELKRPELGDEVEARVFDLDKSIEDLRHGNTAFLAVLLMALSPRLEAIRFVRNPHLDWQPSVLALADVIEYGEFPAPVRIVPLTSQEEDEQRRDGPRPYYSDDEEEDEEEENAGEEEEQDLRQEIKDAYPPGFLSVKEIAVGLGSKAQNTFGANSASASDYVKMTHIAPLLHLPRLKSLWVHGFTDDTDAVDDVAVHWNLPVGCSAVEILVFDCPDQPQRDPVEALIRACGRLKHLTFVDGNIGDHIDCDYVLDWCKIPRDGGRLKSVLWCGTGVHGYRSDMFYPNDFATGYDILTISADDLVLVGVEFPTNEDPAPKQLDGFVSHLLESLVGDARVIVTHGSWGCPEELLEQALIKTVMTQCWGECWEKNENEAGTPDDKDEGEDENGASKNEVRDSNAEGKETSNDDKGQDKLPCGCLASWENHCQYPNFPEKAPALYLEDIDPWIYTLDPLRSEGRRSRDPNAPPRDPSKRPFEELIKCCKLWGVEIYTRTTPAPRFHNVAMPTIASEKDLQTSPWYKHPDVQKLYFKPHKGMADDCANCGECRECYKLHPPECWVQWKEDDAQAEEQRKAWEAEEVSEVGEDAEHDDDDVDTEEDQESG